MNTTTTATPPAAPQETPPKPVGKQRTKSWREKCKLVTWGVETPTHDNDQFTAAVARVRDAFFAIAQKDCDAGVMVEPAVSRLDAGGFFPEYVVRRVERATWTAAGKDRNGKAVAKSPAQDPTREDEIASGKWKLVRRLMEELAEEGFGRLDTGGTTGVGSYKEIVFYAHTPECVARVLKQKEEVKLAREARAAAKRAPTPAPNQVLLTLLPGQRGVAVNADESVVTNEFVEHTKRLREILNKHGIVLRGGECADGAVPLRKDATASSPGQVVAPAN